MQYKQVLKFWFKELEAKDWFRKDDRLDSLIKTQFGDVLLAAAACELYAWRNTPDGRLAEIIVLDQFSRNIYRDTAQAFAQDALALALAQEAVAIGADMALPVSHRAFLYMPYMHSESLLIHEQAIKLYEQTGLENNLDFEKRHRAIIQRFGRYPHRNAILGRQSTPEEVEFLDQPGSSF
ncbi:membrane protein [Pseudohongiella nitratireducens]|uniref:Membrane protein n=1 Tax=Pseudohongiella nitratireducens TaxID=1768907 RepID=A0A916QMD7_9GAMM|nr:DUF924 family protein [Pseudohongiella nitratireducens]MDF1624215.1 DUF924 domain-containing protein [Pseudohongiella nitratireducens]GFZ79824.1 membrane protein [Pseudohongiella nitratireducens]